MTNQQESVLTREALANVIENIKYDCWSANGEEFSSDFSDIIDELEVGDNLYEGVIKPVNVEKFVDVERLIEDIQSSAWDEHKEYAEGYLDNISKEALQELFEIIAAWVNRQEMPTFWSVVNVRERTLTKEDME